MPTANTTPSSENWLVVVGAIDPAVPLTSLQLDTGRIVSVPTSLLTAERPPDAPDTSGEQSAAVIPVLEEELVISKRAIPLETVRLTKSVETRTERRQIPLLKEHWEVTRVPCEIEVSARFGARTQGEVTIYPVFEERVVTRTAIYLVEEIRLQKTSEIVNQQVDGTVQREVVSIERLVP